MAAFRRLLTESWSQSSIASAKTLKSARNLSLNLPKTLIPSKTLSGNLFSNPAPRILSEISSGNHAVRTIRSTLSGNLFANPAKTLASGIFSGNHARRTISSSTTPSANLFTAKTLTSLNLHARTITSLNIHARTITSSIPPRTSSSPEAFMLFLAVAFILFLLIIEGALLVVDWVKNAFTPSQPATEESPAEGSKTSLPTPSEGPKPAESLPSDMDPEEAANQVRKRIEELLKKKGMQEGSYPPYRVFWYHKELKIEIQVPPSCDIQELIGYLARAYYHDSDSLLLAYDNDVAYGLRLPLQNQKQIGSGKEPSVEMDMGIGQCIVLFFRRFNSPDKTEMRFIKKGGSYSTSELYTFIDVLQIAGGKSGQRNKTLPAEGSKLSLKPEPAESASSSVDDLKEIAKEDRKIIEELLKKKGMQKGSYPRYRVFVKDQKVMLGVQIPPACDSYDMIWNLAHHFGVKVELVSGGYGSDIKLRAWENEVAYGLRLTPVENQKQPENDKGPVEETDNKKERFHVVFSHTVDSPVNNEMSFVKEGSFSASELDAFIDVLQVAGAKLGRKAEFERKQRDEASQKSISSLEEMGVKVYGFSVGKENSSSDKISWDNIAGYDQQKGVIEDTVLLALRSPYIYDDIARGTRYKFESNRPRAILFEGPPGTGKTSFARVIANQAGVPLLYVPLEIIMSMWYGESTRLIGKVFSLANQLPTGAIIFLDEIDSFAGSRGGNMHEATRRILSVLQREIDGFEQNKKVIVIGATNHKEYLDPALMSRFDTTLYFGLPDEQSRRKIAAKFAKHLTEDELVEFSQAMDEMSGRDIRDVCKQAERSWASKIIRGEEGDDDENVSLPPLQEYIDSAIDRQKSLLDTSNKKKGQR